MSNFDNRSNSSNNSTKYLQSSNNAIANDSPPAVNSNSSGSSGKDDNHPLDLNTTFFSPDTKNDNKIKENYRSSSYSGSQTELSGSLNSESKIDLQDQGKKELFNEMNTKQIAHQDLLNNDNNHCAQDKQKLYGEMSNRQVDQNNVSSNQQQSQTLSAGQPQNISPSSSPSR